MASENDLVQRARTLRERLDAEKERRERCLNFFLEAQQPLEQLTAFEKCQLQLASRNYTEHLAARAKKLKAGELTVLVLGEICAGKSSVLNMLLGGAYMPTGHDSCSEVPCCIVHSSSRCATLVFSQPGQVSRKISLTDDPEDETWVTLKECIQTGLDEFSAGTVTPGHVASELKEVRIEWPFPYIKVADEKITFIDLPGIHDTVDSFENIHSYVQEADAFLFVINNGEHDGIERDRLLRLIEDVRTILGTRDGTFSPQCFFFVCNKWDRVPDGSKEKLKAKVFKKLKNACLGMSEKQIVFCVSTDEAVENVHARNPIDMHIRFFYGICRFLERSFNQSVDTHCWWLHTLLSKAKVACLNTKMFRKQRVEQKKQVKLAFAETKMKLKDMEKRRTDYEQFAKSILEEKYKCLQKIIKDLLKAEPKEMTDWEDEDVENIQDQETEKEYLKNLKKKIIRKVTQVLEENSHISRIKESIENSTDSRISAMIEAENDYEDNSYFSKFMLQGRQTTIGFRMISKPDNFQSKLRMVQFKLNRELLTRNPKEYMRIQTKLAINYMFEKETEKLARKLLERRHSQLFAFRYFQESFQVYYKAIVELEKDVDAQAYVQSNSERSFERLSERIEILQFVNNHYGEIAEHDLCFDETMAKRLGVGTFGAVYAGTYNLDDAGDIDVAVKVIRVPANRDLPETAFIFRECGVLRTLSMSPKDETENVIEFYGYTTKVVHDKDFRLNLVMEKCDRNLADMIEDTDLRLPKDQWALFPGKESVEVKGRAYIIQLALQAARGLQFLHSNNFIHRDIKAENILVKFIDADKNVSLKICDFGLTRDLNLAVSMGPNIGTQEYNAPEVRKGGVPSQDSDVYSMALIFWEMWYGERISTTDKRPPPMSEVKPPKQLYDLLKRCWSKTSIDRPNTNQVLNVLLKLTDEFPFQPLSRPSMWSAYNYGGGM